MSFVGDSEAKAIVKRDLRNWHGTISEFNQKNHEFALSMNRLTSVEKREELIRKKFKPNAKTLYTREVPAEFSHTIAFLEIEKDQSKETKQALSKSKQKERTLLEQKYKQHITKIKNKKIHAFIVKNDRVENNELLIMIHNTKGNNKGELLRAHSVAAITQHCLERMVQRLRLKNIRDAIDEILGAIVWLEGSGSELAGRPPSSLGKEEFKRHIPTKNGALLLKTRNTKTTNGIMQQECTLITWIHKNQFKIGQEVAKRDFIFALMINRYLSNPKINEEIDKLKSITKEQESRKDKSEAMVSIHGELYPASQFISTLENGNYLDFMIDFEKSP